MKVSITHIGTACVLLELEEGDRSLRILTDPVFDPPGNRYWFGWGTSSRKTSGPARAPGEIGRVDLILLSHDQHADNLDRLGRKFLVESGAQVLSTPQAAARLAPEIGESRAIGLRKWESKEIPGWNIRITATPSRHAQFPLPEVFCGPTTGFLLEWPGQQEGALYISGDTVFFDEISEIGKRHRIHTAILHLGGVRFGISGPIRYTLTGDQARRMLARLQPQTVIPIHFDGWTHFREPVEQSLAKISGGLPDRVRLLRLEPGVRTSLEAQK